MNESMPAPNVPRPVSRLNELLDTMCGRTDQLQNIITRIEQASDRLSGNDSVDKLSEGPRPCRGGVVGRFEDNIDTLDNLLNRLDNVAIIFDGHV